MSLRFRIGPFTFGSSGARLSVWKRGSGVSVPLDGKGRAFGKVGVGPLSWYFGAGKNRIVFWLMVIAGVAAYLYFAH